MTEPGRRERTRVLFVCTHNSARSQMAEGLLRALGGDRFEVESAGTEPGSLHPFAIQAMGEAGIDISLQRSKAVDPFYGEAFDIVTPASRVQGHSDRRRRVPSVGRLERGVAALHRPLRPTSSHAPRFGQP